MTERTYRFGNFVVLVSTRELCAGAAHVDLPARAFDCLVYLIEHRDRAVGRDELIAAVWGRTDVSEALLNHTILKIRRALGSAQDMIRTVPRFGYHWIMAVDTDAPADTVHDAEPPANVREPLAAATAATVPRRRERRRTIALASVVVAALALAAAVAWHRANRSNDAPASHAEDAIAPAMVLPAEIDAPDDWRWLRLGLMDLVANRLRDGALRTAPSETVVALLKQRAASGGESASADQGLARIAALRVLPHVRLDKGEWTVRLDADGMQRTVSVDARNADPIAAAREAADRLLVKLGHTPDTHAEAPSPEVDDVLQRSGAAMLADQLDQARALIEAAPASVRNAPAIEQRLAQIELRTGDYEGAEHRVLALLDRLDAHRDAALRARALITLATSYVRRQEYDKADDAYAEAIALRGEADDPEVRGIAYLGRGIVLSQKSRMDEAVAELGRARIELETSGDALGVATVDVNLGDFQVLRHRPADALAMLSDAAQKYEQLGAREGLVHARIGIAGVQLELLDPAAALATTDRFWPAEAHTSNVRMQWAATRARIEALAANGRLKDASTLIERVRRESDPSRDAAVRAEVEAIAARVALRRGEAAEAARLAETAAVPLLRDSDKALYARNLLLESDALRASGDTVRAADATRRLRALASEESDDMIGLEADLAESAQAWAEGRRDTALQGYAAAMARADKINVPEGIVAVAAPYMTALIEASHLDEARAIGGRIAPWSNRDVRAAWAEVRLFRALDRPDAVRDAEASAARLAGDGPLPGAVEATNGD